MVSKTDIKTPDLSDPRIILAQRMVAELRDSPPFTKVESAFRSLFGLHVQLFSCSLDAELDTGKSPESICAYAQQVPDFQACCEDHLQGLIFKNRSKTSQMTCWAGVQTVAVPIHVGEKPELYLVTRYIESTEPQRKEASIKALGTPDPQLIRAHAALVRLPRSDRKGLQSLLEVCASNLSQLATAFQEREQNQAIPGFLRRATVYISEHIGQKLSLQEVADQVHVSPSHLSRNFKSYLKEGFSQKVTRMRIKHACKLLSKTSRPITEIALQSGFQSISQFNRSFRSIKGTTPGNFRRSEALHF